MQMLSRITPDALLADPGIVVDQEVPEADNLPQLRNSPDEVGRRLLQPI